MRRTSYFVALAVVGTSSLATAAAIASSWFGFRVHFSFMSTLIGLFASPVPLQLQGFLPGPARAVLVFALAALVARRIWVLARTRPVAPPTSLTRWPSRLLSFAVVFLLLMVVGLALSVVLRAGSGVPAALLGLPAALLLAPVVFYVELRSVLYRRTDGT